MHLSHFESAWTSCKKHNITNDVHHHTSGMLHRNNVEVHVDNTHQNKKKTTRIFCLGVWH